MKKSNAVILSIVLTALQGWNFYQQRRLTEVQQAAERDRKLQWEQSAYLQEKIGAATKPGWK